MRNANNGYAVIEESGCDSSDLNERFAAFQGSSSNLSIFEADGVSRWLGVSCNIFQVYYIFGVNNAPGNCLNWLLVNA